MLTPRPLPFALSSELHSCPASCPQQGAHAVLSAFSNSQLWEGGPIPLVDQRFSSGNAPKSHLCIIVGCSGPRGEGTCAGLPIEAFPQGEECPLPCQLSPLVLSTPPAPPPRNLPLVSYRCSMAKTQAFLPCLLLEVHSLRQHMHEFPNSN